MQAQLLRNTGLQIPQLLRLVCSPVYWHPIHTTNVSFPSTAWVPPHVSLQRRYHGGVSQGLAQTTTSSQYHKALAGANEASTNSQAVSGSARPDGCFAFLSVALSV